MKTLYKLTYTALALVPFMFASCTEETLEPEIGNCENVYFQKLDQSDIELEPTDETELILKAFRPISDNADDLKPLTIPIELESSLLESGEQVFSHTPVEFEEGQVEAQFKVKFHEAKVGTTYDCKIKIADPKYISKYSKYPTELSFSVTRVKWIPVKGEDGEKTGIYTDGLLCEALTGFAKFVPREVVIEKRADKPGIFRIKDLYNDAYIGMMLGIPASAVPQTGIKISPSNIIIDARDPKKVVLEKRSTGLDVGYGDIYFYSLCPRLFPNITEAEAKYGTWDQEKGLIKFPPNSIVLETGPIQSIVNQAGKTTLLFPGFEDSDYRLIIKAGLSDGEGKLPVEIVKGRDVSTVKYAVIHGALPPLAIVKNANKIAEGTLEAKAIDAKKFNVELEETGVYTLVFAGFDSKGEYVANAGTQISYVAKGDEMPVIMSFGAIVSDKYAHEGNTAENSVEIYISGKDLTSVYYGLLPKDLFDTDRDLVINNFEQIGNPFPESYLNEINSTVWSGVIDKLKPGNEYVLIVKGSNGYTEKLEYKTVKTEGIFDPTQADYFPGSLQKETSKSDFIKSDMHIWQVNGETKLREDLGKVDITDGGQIEYNGKTLEIVNISGIWTAAMKNDPKFKIEKDITSFVFTEGKLYNWMTDYGEVSAEVIDPETNKTTVLTNRGGLVSFMEAQSFLTDPLTYMGGLTKEGNIAFMDSGEYSAEYGRCLGLFLSMFEKDNITAIISALNDFVLIPEGAVESKPAVTNTTCRSRKDAIDHIMAGGSALERFKCVGRLRDVQHDFDGIAVQNNFGEAF